MKTLQERIKNVEPSIYKHVSRALFYYFWYSDGQENQTNDINKIINLVVKLPEKNQFAFLKNLFLVLVKFWNNIDIHRLNKFLLFVKKLIIFLYSL